MKIDKLQVVKAIAPIAGGSARTGTYISLKNVVKCLVVCELAMATTDTCAIVINQATAVAPVGATPITQVVPIWSNLDCSTSNTLTARTAAVNYTTDAVAKNKIVVFQIDPNHLDSGYDCIGVVMGSSNASNFYSAIYLVEMRYSGADVIAD
jgi:hypothetical protein